MNDHIDDYPDEDEDDENLAMAMAVADDKLRARHTAMLLDLISMQEITQKKLAPLYMRGIRSATPPNWRKVNLAIIDRWSTDGLESVKRLAWELFEKSHNDEFITAKNIAYFG